MKRYLVLLGIAVIVLALAGCGDGAGNGAENGGDGPDAVITVDLGGGVSITMNWIENGSFQMGDPDSGNINYAKPQHSVTLTKGYYMGIHLVTQEQWRTVMAGSDNNIDPSGFINGAGDGEDQAKRPVECVTWYDTIEFCNILSEKTGLESVYTITGIERNFLDQIETATVTADWDKNGFRLPTEAEWEYACRAGTTTHWSFGNTSSGIGSYVWYDYNSGNKTHQVGMKTANAWGLYDMHGNVWERCWDWFDYYTGEAKNDPTGPDEPNMDYGIYRVIRGGGWDSGALSTRSAYRYELNPSLRSWATGFRVVLR